MHVPYLVIFSRSNKACCLHLLSKSGEQHSEFDIRDVWKSVFDRDLRFPDNTLRQEQTLWGLPTWVRHPLRLPSRSSAWCEYCCSRCRGIYSKAVIYRGICKVLIVLYSVNLKISQGREGNSMLPFAGHGNYLSLPWRNLERRLGCTEISGKTLDFVSWCFTSVVFLRGS